MPLSWCLAAAQVGAMVQRFSEVRSEGAMVKSLRQALAYIVEKWPGSFARCGVEWCFEVGGMWGERG